MKVSHSSAELFSDTLVGRKSVRCFCHLKKKIIHALLCHASNVHNIKKNP